MTSRPCRPRPAPGSLFLLLAEWAPQARGPGLKAARLPLVPATRHKASRWGLSGRSVWTWGLLLKETDQLLARQAGGLSSGGRRPLSPDVCHPVSSVPGPSPPWVPEVPAGSWLPPRALTRSPYPRPAAFPPTAAQVAGKSALSHVSAAVSALGPPHTSSALGPS